MAVFYFIGFSYEVKTLREDADAIDLKYAKQMADFIGANKDWEGCNVDDPSARVLANYGDSGK